MDNGSQSNFVSENFANKLGVESKNAMIEIRDINQQASQALREVNLNMFSRVGSFSMEPKCIVLPRITHKLPHVKLDRSKLDIPSNVILADPQFNLPQDVDLLIGAENF